MSSVQGLSSLQSASLAQQLGIGSEKTHSLPMHLSVVQSFSSVHSKSLWQQRAFSTSWTQWKSTQESTVHGSASGSSGVARGCIRSRQSPTAMQHPTASSTEKTRKLQQPSRQVSLVQLLSSSQSDWKTQEAHCTTSSPLSTVSATLHSGEVAVHSSSGRQEQRATHFPEAWSHLRFSSQSVSLLQPSEPPEQAEQVAAKTINRNIAKDNRIP